MPHTIFIITTRHPSLTPSAFRTHYETIHIPLIKAIAAVALVGSHSEDDFDVIAELVFDDEAQFQELMRVVGEGEAAERIKRDEEKFLDRGKTRILVGGGSVVTKRGD
ncbi:MAG: hypothetical protein Q9220_005074 [cf. Caloplaca sp. 1 TL-2023]